MTSVNAIMPYLKLTKQKRVLFLFLIFLSLTLSGSGQFQPAAVKRSANKVTINSKNYYLHEVLKNQTLFGISQAYNVEEEEIKSLNPDLNKKSVFPGMVLRIPDTGSASAPAAKKEEAKFLTHKVLAKETLYSVSKKYGVKVDEIRDLNPDAKWGLKTGMVIKIPQVKMLVVQKETVADDKTIKDASEQTNEAIGNIVDKPCRVKPFPHQDENFNLVILLPLNISQNDTLSYSDTLKPEHFRFYEFLEGIYLAIDSMRLEGLNLTVEVFDTEKNPETIRGIIDSNKIREADLIIGPVFANEIEVVAPYAKNQHITMVSPFSTYDVSKSNPYAFQIRNKLPRQIELATAYLGSKYRQNVVVIGRLSEKSNPDFLKFTANLGTQLRQQDPTGKAIYKTIYYSENSRNFMTADSRVVQIDSYLSASLPNYFILPSENEVLTTEVVNELQQKTTARKISVFGLNQWVFKELDLSNLYNVNLEIYSDFEDDYPYVDFTDPQVLNFCNKYKENWNIEPSKYSFHGFDVAYFFTRALFQFGPDLANSVPCWTEYLNHSSIITPMRFQSYSNSNGFENHAITVIRYQKEELIRKKVN